MAKATCTVVFYAYISAAWVQLDDVTPTRGFWGMHDNSPVTRTPETGDMALTLNNDSGQYTPGGPSALAGWKKGIPFKAEFTFDGEVARTWRGIISDIQIMPNVKDPLCYVTVLDWMDYAAKHPIVNPGIQTNKRGDAVMTTVTNLVSIQPQATEFDTGVETFPTVFDTITSHTKAYNEGAKVALSELGYWYLKKDKVYGETLVFEAADARHGWRSADNLPLVKADSGFLLKEDGGYLLKEDGGKIILNQTAATTFDGSIITDFEAVYGQHVINRMTVYAYPRKLDASAQILFTLSSEIAIGSGQTIHLKGTYANPSGGLPCNGQDMITPVATTDYTVFTATGGGGSNITADLVVVPSYGTEGFDHALTNNNASVGYINKFNCRGTGIYVNNPIEHAATNAASIAEYETESESLNQKYKNDLYSGSVFVESQVDEHNQPRTVLNSISFCANKSNACMMAFLYTDVGSLHYISIPEAGIAGNYYIQGIEFTMSGGVIMCKWIVKLALSLLVGLSPIAVEFAGGAATDGIDYGYVPSVSRDSVAANRTFSAWIYVDAVPAVGETPKIFSTASNASGTWMDIYRGAPGEIGIGFYSNRNGIYYSANLLSINTWYHVLVYYNNATSVNVPLLYVNAVAKTMSTDFGISSIVSETGSRLIIGNYQVATHDYSETFDGKIFDPRFYDMNKTSLTADQLATVLYNAGVPDETLATDGLVFQGFNVRTENLADYVDDTLTSTMTLRDNILGAVGVPHGSPVGRASP